VGSAEEAAMEAAAKEEANGAVGREVAETGATATEAPWDASDAPLADVQTMTYGGESAEMESVEKDADSDVDLSESDEPKEGVDAAEVKKGPARRRVVESDSD